MSKKTRRKALSFAAPIVGGILGGPIGAGLGAGTASYTQNHNLGDALKIGALSGAGSFVGGNIGNAIGGPSVASGLQSTLGPDLGSAIGQAAGGSVALSPIAGILGSQVGSNLGSSLVPQKTKSPVGETAAPFKAKREKEQDRPASFQSFGTLTPTQLSTNIATGGVYGGGQGPQESDYFLNMVNRKLVDDAGTVDTDFTDINPIEDSYLKQLGYGGMKTPTDLLQALSRRKIAA